MPAKKNTAKKVNRSGGDLANPGSLGNVPGQSYGRDLSEKNRNYAAGAPKRAAARTAAKRAARQGKGPR